MSSRRPLSGKTALLLLSGTKVDFVVHGLVITVRFGSSLDQNSSPGRFLGITHSFKETTKRLKCLENAFPAINFPTSRPWASRLRSSQTTDSAAPRTSTQSCRESMPVPAPKKIDFTPYAYVRDHVLAGGPDPPMERSNFWVVPH